ncbi:HET-domain-containing protein, partial [Stipitochalara longipes BDJ]
MLNSIAQPAPWTAFGAANFVPERVDLVTGSRTIRQWLNDCNKHNGCAGYRKSSTILPTRVLDLGEKAAAQDSIKLFETEGSKGTYMTLSHCWGPAQLITTTANTIEQRMAGIPLKDLPQTFKEAVSMTRNLGIRYLWIDSLCIKQLDKEDWEAEASKMGSVYSHSYLNIAATSSAEVTGGCFKERLVSVIEKPSLLAVKSHKIVRPSLGSSVIYVRPVLDSAHTALKRNGSFGVSTLTPLLSRAWVYQERLLAPRTVHFHSTEMLWECISSSRCECGGLDRRPIDIFRPNTFDGGLARDLEEQWFSVVQQYSGLNTSHPSDKLPALSGIAEQFQAKLQCGYLAGLWRNHLLRGLSWIVADGNKACRRLPYRAPTWSWAS